MINMKKRKNNFKFSNRVLYSLITLGILAIFAVGVYAYNTGSPTTSGHTWNEIAGIPAGFADGVDNVGITSESDPYTSGGLYGYCLMRYLWTGSTWGQGTATSECRDAKSPAYCSGYCGCASGYTMVTLTGGAGVPSSSTSRYSWFTFACYKN